MEVEYREGILHINFEIQEEDIENGALEILKVIRPDWEKNYITLKLLTDGITNKLVGCKPEGAEDEETVLVRIYGRKTDLIIDRKAEKRNMILLNKAGIAPNLYASFTNGLTYRFLPGITLNNKSVRDPVISKLVARHMAVFHKIKPSEDNRDTFIWDKITKFIELVPDVFSDSDKNERYIKNVPHKSIIEQEVYKMRQIVENLGSPIVFCHNDLLLGNVIYNEQENKVTFIDYEYAAPNYQSFDIANHFAEFVGLDKFDYSLYPDKKFQTSWIRTYLTELEGREPTDEQIETIYVQVTKTVLLTHIFWGIWSLVQAEHSTIDFDYMGYAAVRFNEYFTKKDKFLNLEASS
ncbi:ethanolamine kinase 1 [Diorhabda carinulata]|uniref:ethanolamine kinase 1 n=1 Tax=Diorhabda carinulata TaxID=1163345 RepID=UPI0025A18A2C|nr:ethanolamine kinase 1 [Diorhabda carinulata]XP_057669732.1 ethanolamine kinase 1 [Diorhabda carinulata]XP_057669733.1 ethanolamine kinase 1 [Diorhabda carinulata]XP_057669734.1 ethanolamine kinase 1 [Diorhabda carinulata]XP_057669735.1 ethanolamine kinase 1 [Diorhabda carinulata]XP_057669736.1 ethanolamine kinase 1 [Diorhabda carinulata]XP_057669738.1 ethanolamine kinase 1 [Diorhabda carinulata]